MSPRPTRLTLTVFGLVLITGVVHFAIGVGETFAAVSGGGTLAFGLLMLSGGLLAFGLVGSYYTGVLTPTYTHLGVATLMVLYIAAYADVHALGTLESLTGVELHAHDHHNGHDHDSHDHNGHDHNGHDHEGGAIETVIDHLRDDSLALATKLIEVTAGTLSVIAAALYKK